MARKTLSKKVKVLNLLSKGAPVSWTTLRNKFDLTVEEADSVITNVFKVPKTGVFGLIDVVGLDLMPAVVNSLLKNIEQELLC